MSNLNYGVVGNCRTAALISEKGSIDWLCFPDFDSSSIFASLLDRERGGSFGFDVTEDHHISQSYVPHTNILSTSFSSKEGEFVVLDYMPYYRSCENAHYLPAELYRYVRWIKGKPRFKVNYVPALLIIKIDNICILPFLCRTSNRKKKLYWKKMSSFFCHTMKRSFRWILNGKKLNIAVLWFIGLIGPTVLRNILSIMM